ncbi:MAG: uracil phosphoribosyltransferase [Candidatus Saccharibacteria bacterium]|nr:uracil phosphoribosyltransferase [Candidatus Saccharibacteria bacterium]
MKIVNLSKNVSVLQQYLHEIRDTNIQKDRKRFVQNLERIGAISAYEISKELAYSKNQAHTPLTTAETNVLAVQPVIATIIRAGLPPYTGFLQIFDDADSAFIAAHRQLNKVGVMESVIGYSSSPNLNGRPLIIADTMIATGTTIVDIYNKLLEYGQPTQVFVSGVIVSQPAVDFLQKNIPNITLYTATIDPELNEQFFIVPGLGDAGDISYGEKFEKS